MNADGTDRGDKKGYARRLEITRDHLPPGAPEDPLLWSKWYFRAAQAYAQVKRALAHYHAEDVVAYYDVKDPVCDIIMAGAELWAEAVQWQPGPSDA